MRRGSKKPLLALLAAALLALSGYFLWRYNTPPPDAGPSGESELPVFDESPSVPPSASRETPEPSRAPQSASPSPSFAEPSPSPYEPITSEPVRALIPAIGAEAEIAGTERDDKANSMAVYPSASVISWYKRSAVPGNEGNAILAGHNKWKGEKGVIADLGLLEIGDELTIIYEDGSERTFCLESVFEYELKTAPGGEIMRVDGPARVTVITCSGKFNAKTGTSENRLVAVFKPSEVFVTPEPPVTPIPENK